MVRLEDVLADLEEWIEENFDLDMWNVEVEKHSNASAAIYLRYHDAYDIERISIDISINEYGVPTFYLATESANIDNEIIHCDSCHDCVGEDCWIYEQFATPDGEIDSEKLDKYVQEEIDTHLSLPKIETFALGCELRVEPAIVETDCYLDIPHIHQYKGVALTFETQSIEVLKAIILTRDLWYNLITF